jgi:hypothetical protein
VFKPYPYFFLLALMRPIAVAAELRDPTLPGNLPQAQVSVTPSGEVALNLSAIWVSGIARRAIINGVRVTAGQTLADGSQVVKIQPRYVVIRQHGAIKKLYLSPSVLNPVK